MVVLLEPRGEGLAGVLTLADTIRAGMRAARFAGIVTGAPTPPTVDDALDRGAYAHVSFAVTYHFDLMG